jgi:hypothetical protein
MSAATPPSATIAWMMALSSARAAKLRSTPQAAQVGLDPLLGNAAAAAHQGHPAERRERDGGAPERRVGGHQQEVVIVEQLFGRERPVREREAAEGDVDLAPAKQLHERAHVWPLVDLKMEVGIGLRESGGRSREYSHADTLERPHPHGSGAALRKALELSVGDPHASEHGLGMAQQQGRRGSEAGRPAAAGAVDQRLADETLERGDLMADRRLGVAELVGGSAEGSGDLDRLERGEVAQLHAHPPVCAHATKTTRAEAHAGLRMVKRGL